MIGRQLPEAAYQALKAATRALIAQCGGLDAAAVQFGRGRSRIHGYGDRNAADRWAPLDLIADLESYVGAPLITQALAAASNHTLVPLPQVAPCAADPIALGRLARETGDVLSKLGSALADGRISRAEGTDIAREIDDAVGALLALRAGLGAEED